MKKKNKKRKIYEQPSDLIQNFIGSTRTTSLFLKDKDLILIQFLYILYNEMPKNLFMFLPRRLIARNKKQTRLCSLYTNVYYKEDYEIHSNIFKLVIAPILLHIFKFKNQFPKNKFYRTCRGEVKKNEIYQGDIPFLEIKYSDTEILHKPFESQFKDYKSDLQTSINIYLPNNVFKERYYYTKDAIYVEKYITEWCYKNQFKSAWTSNSDKLIKEITFDALIKDLLWLADQYGLPENKHPIKTLKPWVLNEQINIDKKEVLSHATRYYHANKV